MSKEISGMWVEYMESLTEGDADTLIKNNNQLTDLVLYSFGDIVDEYQLFVESGGTITAPYPCRNRRERGKNRRNRVV